MSTYAAFVAEIKKVQEIPGADRIHTAFVMGEQVVVSKDWGVGMVGLFFPADTQLSEDFCKHNNLFRKSEMNIDPEKTGFFEQNRRVRCQPFLKVRSEGFFTQLSALDYLGVDVTKFKVGESFDEINGVKICQKYVNEKTKRALSNKLANGKKAKVKEYPNFPKHVDSEQFRYYVDHIEKGDIIYFHAKRHGTSGRSSCTKVIRTPSTISEKVLDFFGLFKRESWETVLGTRNVILSELSSQDKEGFHGSEKFRYDIHEQIKPFLEKGMVIYYELYGFANGSPIMPNGDVTKLKDKRYTKKYGNSVSFAYGCKEHETKFHIYRIAYVSEDGHVQDLSDAQCRKWCLERGFDYALEVHPPMIYDGDKEALEELVERLTERPECLTEDYWDSSQISEGIMLRIERGTLVPMFLKSKAWAFKVLEGILKEQGEVDMEESS